MSVEKIAQYISEQVRKERALGLSSLDEATVSIDYSKAKGHADPEHGGGNRYSSKHKADHLAALKKAGASDEHAAAIHAHANASDHQDSNKSGYQVMSKHGKFTVHSKHIGDADTMGGSGHVKYHVAAN